MRKILYVFSLLTLLVSCDKIDDLTKFNLDYETQVTIPSSAGINLPFDVLTPETETDSESKFNSNDTRKDLIEEIKLTQLQLVITSPSDADFSFLESIEVYISADGLEEIKIASKLDVPETVSILDLEVSDADLKEYIKKDSYNLRLNTVTDEAMSQDHEIDVNSTFFVDAKILGL
ncbi:hypothetical protein FGM00_00100 [Aggregatimonas sangjinii]|uniref:Lipoprotein n=1 Tax=Aggregatimonas sangjinii TaxID=2583587 RepID=A0A5B7SJI9_9FLAO|nr:hypothetical protein [Aggregatimonas sangjinii]QCW98596.1 hypothetical protein FGM00_00100 [Aggregatimonas sangjinii]